MKAIKKIHILVLTILMVFAFAACDAIKGKDVELVLSADKQVAKRGETVTLSVTKDGTAVPFAKGEITFSVAEGAEYVNVVDDKISIKSDAADDAVIKVVAKSGETTSNTVEIKVDVPLVSIEASAGNVTEAQRGSSVVLTKVASPANCNDAISWVIVEGADYATISGDVLVVKATAPTNTVIKVKAVSGKVESNVLTFTVPATQEEINSARYWLSFDEDKITLDRNGISSPVLEVSAFNYNFEAVNDLTIDFTVENGAEFLEITPNGYTCALAVKGHGTATVRATVRGTDVYKDATVNVILPPEQLKLPGVFVERPGYVYNFSMVDPATAAAEMLPFEVSAVGTNVCGAYELVFTHEDGTVGETVAVYENGNITFKKTGIVTVTAKSTSGSRVETTASYKFNINNGYNVSTFEELRDLANNAAYTGNLPINVVVLEKPDGSANGYTYGYELVPALALKAKAEQTFVEICNESANTIKFFDKGLYLNGNNHKVNVSQVRIPTAEEFNQYSNTEYSIWSRNPAVISVAPQNVLSPDSNNIAAYQVNIYDFEVIGNCPIDLETTAKSPNGIYNVGILIGRLDDKSADDDAIRANYYVDMKNVDSSASNIGFRFIHVVGNGVVDGTNVYNCFSNGIETFGSIMRFKDMVYGACGAVGIEIAPQENGTAGVKRNQTQQITYEGSVTVNYINDGNTRYFQNYKINVGGNMLTIPEILNFVFKPYYAAENGAAIMSNMYDPSRGFVFVSFIFHDLGTGEPNNSEIIYPNFQEGGIIKASELTGVDTTHQYIELDVAVPGVANAGKAIIYNLNYKGE